MKMNKPMAKNLHATNGSFSGIYTLMFLLNYFVMFLLVYIHMHLICFLLFY
jgi:hypothetical protein